ncbi:Putative glycosyl transferase [Planktothrix tepida]|uniref:Putative glycosyl transferase n=1 Tax=Planktothrix tepida PCC 9214 TaxID=671072 RepID=A0A1J1LRB6_9CYAN|nr:glycosyltransferase family A protein [Planktothrix tepida]CAD5961728.1 Putative glycosyl transferase [Planktothrix tepida]CUR34782.1 putative glycosyl transferase [Planktothrix tepida PCC 9214]
MTATPLSISPHIQPTLTITIFAVPKPFRGQIGIIQRNAIQSWTKLQPQPEIILLGTDQGTQETAIEFGLRYIPDINVNAQGTPLLNSIFFQASQQATHRILTYVNSDIILTRDFIPTVQQVVSQYPQFLILGRRWNLDITDSIDYNNPNWEQNLRDRLHQAGTFSGVGALDYFVFPKPLFSQLPEFAIGRAGWDNWMVGEGLKQNIPVINASQIITAIHQNHDYHHLPGHRLEAFQGTEAQHNQIFLQNHFAGNSADATIYLTPLSANPTPKVSVIIPTTCVETRHGTSLPTTIDSVYQQTFTDFEIIVVDDNNSIGEMRSLLTREYPLIRYIHQPSSGIVAAYNQGLEVAEGEFITFLHPPEVFLPNKLAQQVACFEQKAGSLEMVFSSWKTPSSFWNHNINLLAFGSVLQGREGLHGVHGWMLPTLWQFIRTSTILFRRSWVQRYGGFNPQLSEQAAILDLLLNLSSRGAAAVCLEQPTICSLEPKPLTVEKINLIAAESEQLLQNYFSRPTVKPWMRPLDCLAYTQTFQWLASLISDEPQKAKFIHCYHRYFHQTQPFRVNA